MQRAAPGRFEMDLPGVGRVPSDLRRSGSRPGYARMGSRRAMFFINMVVAGLHSYAGVG